MCTVLLPLGDNPIAVNKYIIPYQIHELILEDRRISAKSTAEQLGISRERIGSIIQEDLDMRKLSAKWVPKCLDADQNVNGANRLSNIWNSFGAI